MVMAEVSGRTRLLSAAAFFDLGDTILDYVLPFLRFSDHFKTYKKISITKSMKNAFKKISSLRGETINYHFGLN